MKKNNTIKAIFTIAIIVMLITISTLANAATGENYSVGMALSSDSKLKEGETITVNVKLTSVNAGNGIDTITAALQYDTNVFEALTTSSFTASNEWTPTYAATSNMITLIKNSKVKAAETVLTIKLKVKSSISVESTTITLKEIVASGGRVVDGGTGDITVSNASVTINKEKATSTTTNTTTSTTNTTIKDNTVTNLKTLPKTGIEQVGIIALMVVAIVGVCSYVLYKKTSKIVK